MIRDEIHEKLEERISEMGHIDRARATVALGLGKLAVYAMPLDVEDLVGLARDAFTDAVIPSFTPAAPHPDDDVDKDDAPIGGEPGEGPTFLDAFAELNDMESDATEPPEPAADE